MATQKFDVELADLGTIWSLVPLTSRARRWVKKNLPEAVVFAGRVVIESRYAPDIFQGMQKDGLYVVVPVAGAR